jgi:hypothetical protein
VPHCQQAVQTCLSNSPDTRLGSHHDPCVIQLCEREARAAGQARLGFALHVAPSGVDHPEAGAGLWLTGRAEPGAVVALYPGIVYTRAHLRRALNPVYPS